MEKQIDPELTTQTSYITCPECGGDRLTVGLAKFTSGGCGPFAVDCQACNGSGKITLENFANMAHGNKLQEYRVNVMELGLREAADQWGMKASELSAIERGKVITSWVPPGYVDC